MATARMNDRGSNVTLTEIQDPIGKSKSLDSVPLDEIHAIAPLDRDGASKRPGDHTGHESESLPEARRDAYLLFWHFSEL